MKHISLLGLCLAFLSACTWHLNTVQPAYYRISDTLSGAGEIESLILPYKQHTDSLMGETVGELPFELVKEKPNGNLGLWMADACMNYARRLDEPADVVLLNQGGIRRPYLAKGRVSLGMMYELMPFDNQLVALKVKGALLKEILTLAVDKGGEPMTGALVTIHSELVEIQIGEKKLEENNTYVLITNDYMYNGGDGYGLMQNAENPRYLGLIRDILIEEIGIKSQTFPNSGTLRWIWYE
ncbi:MAG: 5'-nucleotidase C-terminal domain-containing protein [Bacteroidota bacterium]|nr:5'-nucleotidase C-terminal domain-containing protein [Bacteroidota bacterium]